VRKTLPLTAYGGNATDNDRGKEGRVASISTAAIAVSLAIPAPHSFSQFKMKID